MLSQLYIENIAVIEKVSLNFDSGFSVLTGETGAGKSILIDALNAILGTRTSKELIRTGASEARISALFSELKGKTIDRLSAFGVEVDENGDILLERTINRDGRSACRINGRPATVAQLREAGVFLVNIHGQHDNQRLLSAESHISYLDEFGKLKPVFDTYQQAYQEYKTLARERKRIRMNEEERARRIDLLTYQIEEIEAARLEINEEKSLIERKNRMLNAERLVKSLTAACQSLNGTEEGTGAIETLEQAAIALSEVTAYLKDGQGMLDRLEEISLELQDISSALCEERDRQDYSDAELADIEERLDLIYRLSLKYGSSIGEILSFLDRARDELSELEQLEQGCAILDEKCGIAENAVIKSGEALREARRNAALDFTERMNTELRFLDMERVMFAVEQEETAYSAGGGDAIQFLISTNPGESPKPLSKIVSGGELSRIMLALKNVLIQTDDIDTLIFDEIDTGISGHAAQRVGSKIKQVSAGRQVICVTHLAQIASMADTHYLIEKHVEDERTYTKVNKLSYSERLTELARIMGNPDSDIMRESAGELLNSAGIFGE